MKALIRLVLAALINYVIVYIAIVIITVITAVILDLIFPNITEAELLTKKGLISAYLIGMTAGVILWLIIRPITRKVYNYVCHK